MSAGGRLRDGQVHSSVPGSIMPVLVHLVWGGGTEGFWLELMGDSKEDSDWFVSGGHDPTNGKFSGTTWSLMQASLLM